MKKFFHIQMEPTYAQNVLRAHYAAFSQSGCVMCDGNCCSWCASADGYLDGYTDEQTIQRLKAEHGWDTKTGFRGEAGCKLPITKRSPTCLAYYCGDKSQWLEGDDGFHNTFTGKRLGLRTRHQRSSQLMAVGRLRELLERKFQED
jgi:hypothetical protein